MPIILLAFFALYALTTAQNFSAASDSNWLIYDIDHNNPYSPHHLLYILFAEKWIDLWRWVGSDADSALIVQLLNAVFGALTMCIFYLILRIRLFLDRFPASVATILPGVSYGFWFYSTTIEVYIIPLFFLLLSLTLLSSRRLTLTAVAVAGASHGGAILFHQMNVLFVPVVALALWYNRKLMSFFKSVLCYLVTIVPVVVIPYLIVMLAILKLHTLSKIWYWLTYYSHVENYWSSLNPSLIVKAAVGFGRTIIGGHFLLAISAFPNFARRTVGGKRLLDEAFLVRHMNGTVANILLLLSLAVLIILIAVVCLRLRFWRQIWREHHVILGLSLVWILAYSCFFLFWDTSNLEFWIAQSVVFWLIVVTLSIRPRGQIFTFGRNTILLPTVAVLLLVINFAGSIQWLMHHDNDYYYIRTETLANHAQRGDLVVIGRWWILDYYLRRFSEAEVLSLFTVYTETQGQQALDKVNDAIRKTWQHGGKVLLSGEAVHSEPETIDVCGEGILKFVDELWAPYRNHWTMIPSEIDTIYLLKPK